MQTIWPAYEGSVSTSWYPVIEVLKTTSPSPMTSAPSATPTKARPSSRTSAAWRFLSGNDHRLVDAVLLLHQHLDALGVRGRHVLADVVGADGKLAVAAVDEHGELDRAGPPEIHHRVHRRAGGAPMVDDVVDEDDDLAPDIRHVARRVVRCGSGLEVVAVQRHVEPAERHPRVLEPRQRAREPLREQIALADDAHEHHVADSAVALDDLVGDAGEGAAYLVGVHHRRLEGDAHESSLS